MNDDDASSAAMEREVEEDLDESDKVGDADDPGSVEEEDEQPGLA